jgi:hypothetical protein
MRIRRGIWVYRLSTSLVVEGCWVMLGAGTKCMDSMYSGCSSNSVVLSSRSPGTSTRQRRLLEAARHTAGRANAFSLLHAHRYDSQPGCWLRPEMIFGNVWRSTGADDYRNPRRFSGRSTRVTARRSSPTFRPSSSQRLMPCSTPAAEIDGLGSNTMNR